MVTPNVCVDQLILFVDSQIFYNQPKEKLFFGQDSSLHHAFCFHDFRICYKKVTRIYDSIIATVLNEVVQVLHDIKLQLFGNL